MPYIFEVQTNAASPQKNLAAKERKEMYRNSEEEAFALSAFFRG